MQAFRVSDSAEACVKRGWPCLLGGTLVADQWRWKAGPWRHRVPHSSGQA